MAPAPNLAQSVAEEMDYPLAYTQAGSGQPVLLIHGSLCDYRYWRWQIPEIGQQFRVLAPSLRGYWPAAFHTVRQDFDVIVQTQDLLEFVVQTCGDTPVHVVGHSRGARVAIELACVAPDRVQTLVLADPGFSARKDSPPAQFQLDAAAKLKSGDIDGALTQFIDTVSGPDTWRRMVGWFKTMALDNATTLLSQIAEQNYYFDMSRARDITCPCLLINGDSSPARFTQTQNALQQVLPQSQRAIIPMASHGMNLANPRAFNQVVVNFLLQNS